MAGQTKGGPVHSDMALLDAPARPVPVDKAAALRLMVAGAAWSLPMNAVRGIAEAAPPTTLPLTGPPIEGVTAVEGRPVLQIDMARALGQSSYGHVVVVVATKAGDVALRVDDARWSGGADAPALDLARWLPWTGGAVAVTRAVRPAQPPVATLPLLRVHHDGAEVALLVDRLERIDRPDWSKPLPESAESLIGVGGSLLPAHGSPSASAYALVLRGDAAGERAALLVERAFAVERCPLDRLAAVRHPGGGASLWWRRTEGAPLRVVDPGPLFGWTAASVASVAPDSAAHPLDGAAPARPDALVVEAGGHAVALPLALVGSIEEPATAGGAIHVRLAGGRRMLRVERVQPLGAATADWQPLTALPPAAALLFDAARWDDGAGRWGAGRWVFRANADTLTQLRGKGVAWAAKRGLAAAWRGWSGGSAP